MIKKLVVLSIAVMFTNSAVAGKITTNPTASAGDEIVSVSVLHSNITKFKVYAKTNLETFSIEVASYADASALATDLKKDSTLHCRIKSNLRTSSITTCKIIEIKFDD